MKTAVIAGALALVVCLAWATEPEFTSANDNAIRGLEYAWNQAEMHHDVKAVDALLADSFIRVDNRGQFVTKQEYLRGIADASERSQQVVNEDIAVFIYGDTAIAASTYHVKGTRKGKAFVERGRFIDTWVRLRGDWRCVANQETLIR
jgi:ketosteroid isomerase-like protein